MQIKEATSGFLLPCTLHYISQELAKKPSPLAFSGFQHIPSRGRAPWLAAWLLALLSQVMEPLKDSQHQAAALGELHKWQGCHCAWRGRDTWSRRAPACFSVHSAADRTLLESSPRETQHSIGMASVLGTPQPHLTWVTEAPGSTQKSALLRIIKLLLTYYQVWFHGKQRKKQMHAHIHAQLEKRSLILQSEESVRSCQWFHTRCEAQKV